MEERKRLQQGEDKDDELSDIWKSINESRDMITSKMSVDNVNIEDKQDVDDELNEIWMSINE